LENGGNIINKGSPHISLVYYTQTAPTNPQDHTAATFTKKIQKADGEISPDGDPQKTYKKIQAFDEWPGAFYFIEKGGRRLRIKVVDAELRDGKLYILKIVPEGGKLMEYEDFMRNIHKN
jgi:methionyl-tRNA formyltransferase